MKRLISLTLSVILTLFGIYAQASSTFTAADVQAALEADKKLFDRSAYDFDEDAVYWEETDRENPLPLGATVWMKTTARSSSTETYVEIRIIDVIRGKQANDIVQNANTYNDEPSSDEEMIVAKLEVRAQSTDKSSKFSISDYGFDFVSESGLVYKSTSLAGLDDSLEMFSGATGILELAQIINKDDFPVLLYDDDVWMSLGDLAFPLN